MKIDELIKTLKQIKNKHGNIECVQETTNFFNNIVDLTIESVKIIDFNNDKAVRLNWRT